jgi:D-Tyr-tRNAtyr deacylase
LTHGDGEAQADKLALRLAQGITVATGRFRADMDVRLLNQGPVTITIDVD